MTMNRSSDPNDSVAIITWPEVFEAINALEGKLGEAGIDMSSKETRTEAFDALQSLTGKTDRATKRTEQVKKNTGRSNTPAEIQTVQWVQANIPGRDGKPMSAKQAWNLSHTARHSPHDFFARFIKEETKKNDKRRENSVRDPKKTMDQIVQEARQQYGMILKATDPQDVRMNDEPESAQGDQQSFDPDAFLDEIMEN